jgi:hypothetical protein
VGERADLLAALLDPKVLREFTRYRGPITKVLDVEPVIVRNVYQEVSCDHECDETPTTPTPRKRSSIRPPDEHLRVPWANESGDSIGQTLAVVYGHHGPMSQETPLDRRSQSFTVTIPEAACSSGWRRTT